jgi:hypothetical protein
MLRLSKLINRDLFAGRVQSPLISILANSKPLPKFSGRSFHCSPYVKIEDNTNASSHNTTTTNDQFKEPPKRINFFGHEIDVKTYKDLMSENLELANSVLTEYLKTLSKGKKSSENLVGGLPREIPGFFSEYANEILNIVTKDIPKDAYKELYLKGEISKKVNQIVLNTLNEMLVDMREISNKDFTKLKY